MVLHIGFAKIPTSFFLKKNTGFRAGVFSAHLSDRCLGVSSFFDGKVLLGGADGFDDLPGRTAGCLAGLAGRTAGCFAGCVGFTAGCFDGLAGSGVGFTAGSVGRTDGFVSGRVTGLRSGSRSFITGFDSGAGRASVGRSLDGTTLIGFAPVPGLPIAGFFSTSRLWLGKFGRCSGRGSGFGLLYVC